MNWRLKSRLPLLAAFVFTACSGTHNGTALTPDPRPAQEHNVAAASLDLPDTRFNEDGNILIADQFNNRVIEIDRMHRIVWHFGTGSSVAGPQTVVAPNDAERFGDLTVIAGTGAPPGTEPRCARGCQDNRVIVVDKNQNIVWQYGQAGVAGAGHDQLNAPVCSVYLRNGDILITDQGNQRVIEVTPLKQIVFQYGTTGVSGHDENQLNNPNSAELLDNGHYLIADESNNRVIEIDKAHNIVWQYGNRFRTDLLNAAAFASRLENGNTLISDSGNNRIIEVDVHHNVVWSYVTNARAGSVANPNPTRAVRLRNGDTLISDQFNHQVIEVNHMGQIVFAQGKIATPGLGFDLLNAPYDAKVIGDYTGLTPP